MSGVIEVTSLKLVDFVPMPDEVLKKLQAKYSYWMPMDIPAGYYPNQPKAIKQYGDWNFTIIHEDIPEDMVYNITRALYENAEELVLTKEQMKYMKLENLKYIPVPFHPGAQKYYSEKGYGK